MESTERTLPEARGEHLLLRSLPDGLMVYDTERHRAHYLNRAAALVWQQCDGRTPVAAMAGRLQAELGLPAEEELVWLALARLRKAALLREGGAGPEAVLSRRAVMRKLGLAGGLAALLPLVESLVAPAPAAAASATPCGGEGQPCPCCRGFTCAGGMVCVPLAPSDRNLKEGFAAVDAQAILARLAAIPITSWSYKEEGAAIRHIGPMAQDFAAAFGVGADDRHIALVDANGVAMAAIQALHQQLQERDRQLGALQAEVAALKERLGPAA